MQFSLKTQLCMCMCIYTLFLSVRNKISDSVVEEQMVLHKSNILFLWCVKVPRSALVFLLILRVLVVSLYFILPNAFQEMGKKIWA